MTRIGVSGHRRYRNEADVAAMTEAILHRVLDGDDSPVVVSNIAAGADQLVAELVLDRRGARLHVLLPLPADDYGDDFTDDGARGRYESLMSRAESVEVIEQIEGESRESAYERAGRAIVDACDVLVALWDGKPARGQGGTAEMVKYALDHDVMVEVVLVERDPA